MAYMKTALKPLPVAPFPVPEGVVFAEIDPASGLLAPDGEKGVFEVFLKGTEPTRQAAAKGSPSQFYKFDQM
jgi:penicillin-binding protein 1A